MDRIKELWLHGAKKVLRITMAATLLQTSEPVLEAVFFGTLPITRAAAAAPLEKGAMEFGVWGGGSPGPSTLIGKTEDRELLLFGLRYGWVFANSENVAYEYTFDLIPAAVFFEPREVRGKSSIYGLGFSPLGIKVNFARRSSIQPFASASVGMLYFDEEVPVPGSSRLNVTPEVGLGVQFFLSPRQAVTLGYKYHHISNAYTARKNPGLDSNVIYAGFSFFLMGK